MRPASAGLVAARHRTAALQRQAGRQGCAVSAACAPPPGFKGDVLRLNAELVGGIVAQPDTWAALAVADRGALAVRDDSGFSAMLAMKKGDRIEQANGIALRAPDDIVNAVLRPLVAGQSGAADRLARRRAARMAAAERRDAVRSGLAVSRRAAAAS